MVGVSMAFHAAICECFEGTMLEPCLLKPCFHVAGLQGAGRRAGAPRQRVGRPFPAPLDQMYMRVYIYIYIYVCRYTYIHIHIYMQSHTCVP